MILHRTEGPHGGDLGLKVKMFYMHMQTFFMEYIMAM